MSKQPHKERVFRFFLPFLLAGIVMAVQAGVFLAIAATLVFLHQLGAINLYEMPQLFPIALSIGGLAVGALFSALLLRYPLRPLRSIIEATDKIAAGDYSVRVEPKGLSEFRRLGDKFNHMAEELDSVELLRTDFINNFSHEFKTPIVSIRGFAKMLESDELSPEERREYLGIIIEESERLAALSTNVLELGKLEQQSILSDRTAFSLSEQLRHALAQMLTKWDKKDIDLVCALPEIEYTGSEPLLKEVWVNLFDNAMKFAPQGGTVRVTLSEAPDAVTVTCFNEGEPIEADALPHLFDKFYQADASRNRSGSGLGLSIAKRIVELHGGSIRVLPEAQGNAFTVVLPKA